MKTNDCTGKSYKILIVDDKQENLQLLSQILEMEGFEVAFALDGETAIENAKIFLPDLILLDVMMPGIDGFETCRRLQMIEQLKSIPIIFVTGKSNVNDVVEGFNLGAVDYVTKPIRHEEILVRVETQLKMRSLLNLRDNLIEQLKKQNDDLKSLAKLKEEQLEKSEKFSHLGEMVGELAHEISTPLGVINTAITSVVERKTEIEKQLAEQKMTKRALDDFLLVSGDSYEIVLSNLRHAIHLVDSFRQIIVGEFNQTQTKFDVAHYLEDIQHILSPKLKKTRHKVEINCEAAMVMFAESGSLSQVLLNIINNALIHAFLPEQCGRILVSAKKQEANIVFQVADDGVGISDDNQQRMFDKYYTTRGDNGGSGLGLYIVKKIVEEKLDGQIHLCSEEGKGSCFTIILPCGL